MLIIKVILFVTLIIGFYLFSIRFLQKTNWYISVKGAIAGLIIIFPYILFISIPSNFQPSNDLGAIWSVALIYMAVFVSAGFIFGFILSLFKK